MADYSQLQKLQLLHQEVLFYIFFEFLLFFYFILSARGISLQLSKNNLMLFSSSDVIPWKDKSSNYEITEKANSFCKNGVIHELPLRI